MVKRMLSLRLAVLTLILWPALAAGQATTRTLSFPAGASLGALLDLNHPWDLDYPFWFGGEYRLSWWNGIEYAVKKVGEARGKVRVGGNVRPGLNVSLTALESSATLEALAGIKAREIPVIYGPVTPKNYTWVGRLDPAIDLYLEAKELDEAMVAELARHPELKGLKLWYHEQTTRTLELLSRLTSLEEVSLENLKSSALIHLARLPRLRALAINHPTPDEGLRALAKLAALERLEMSNMDRPRMEFIERPPRLKDLSFTGNGGFTEKDLASFERFNGLETLYSQYGIGDAALARLKAITTLKSLTLGSPYTNVTEAGAAQLAQMKGLDSLNLSTSNLEDGGLARLTELPHLRRLGLTNDTSLSEAGLAPLKRCQHLELLHLRGKFYTVENRKLKSIDYTDAALATFAAMPALNRVVIFMGQPFSAAALADLKRRRPDLEVVLYQNYLKQRRANAKR